jgi:hypothetical protein
MIKLKDLLDEKVKVFDEPTVRAFKQDKSYNLIMQRYFPLTPKIAKIIYGDIRFRGFHMTNYEGLKGVINMQGSSKSISVLTKLWGSNKESLCGPLKCGVGLYVEGNLIFNSSNDLVSVPDEAGRRWIEIFRTKAPFSSKLQLKFEAFIKSDSIYKSIEETISYGFFQTVAELKKLVSKLIARYIGLCERFVSAPENKQLFQLMAHSTTELDDNDEQIINRIKIIDVVIGEAILNKINTMAQFNNFDKEGLYKKINSNISGKLYIAAGSGSDTIRSKFFSSKVGIVDM